MKGNTEVMEIINDDSAASAEEIIGQLTTDDLIHFNLCVHHVLGNPNDSRTDSEPHPWFPQVEALFTEDGGREISQETKEAIAHVLRSRMPQE